MPRQHFVRVRHGYLLELRIVEVSRSVVLRALRTEAPVAIHGENHSASAVHRSAKRLGEERKTGKRDRASLNEVSSVHDAFRGEIVSGPVFQKESRIATELRR